jgi:hypothetical protein
MPAIREALMLQKTELEERFKQRYVKRDAKIREINSNLIKVIIGPRRAGKSFFAIHEIKAVGNFGYANFDDETLAGAKDYNEIVAELDQIYSKPKFLLFDEIQNLPRWQLFVNRLQRQGYNLVVTGSNSNLLSSELATHLTGRHMPTSITPLSFRELVSSEGREMIDAEKRAKLAEYAISGGYPEPIIQGLDYKSYLSTLVDSVLYKDIVKRYRIRKPKAIEELASYLLSNVANAFSYDNLTKMTGIDSTHTAKKYVGYLEEAFIFFGVTRYSAKMREQLKSNRKIYCIDNGIVSAKAFKILEERGRLYENLVAIELWRRASEGEMKFYYWKDPQSENEVDFVIREERSVTSLVQVCYDPSNTKTKSREVRALLKASKELSCNNLLVLTDNYEGEEDAEWYGIRGRIKFVAIWRWLLG